MKLAARALWIAALGACGNTPGKPDAPPPPWTDGPTLPKPRLEPGVAVLGQRLVVLGGFDTDQQAGLDITTEVDVLDTTTVVTAVTGPGTGTWSQLAAAPQAWTHIQLATIGTTLYLLGGLEGAMYVAHGESYSLDTSNPAATWKPLAVMPLGFERGSAAVIVAPPRIYLLGGASSTAALATNLYYDTEMDAWCPGAACPSPASPLPDLPAPRSHPAGMLRADGALVVATGLSTLDSTSQSTDVYLLPVGTTSWQTKTPLDISLARGGCAYGVLQGKLACVGGEAGTSALSTLVFYDPVNDVWSQGPSMPDSRAGTQGAVIGERLWVPGGAARIVFEPTDSLYVFSPLDIPPDQ